MAEKKLPKLGLLYLDYVLRFFDKSNFKGWPDKIETVVYHWKNDKDRFIEEVKRKKIDVLVGNIPATAYETFREIAKALPHVRFLPSVQTQFSNKSKENVTRFCEKHQLSAPKTEIFYDTAKGFKYLEQCSYPKIIKRSYGPSNYGGYYVHKVDSKEEAIALFKKKKYHPMYIQECIPLRADIRVMLIGHKPVCAFWRKAGKDEWITNTSQGGDMSYSGVPMGALELAVEASKASKAEYWACDIAEHDGQFYILECATAFAAFPYIRDWIGQYVMWDISQGKFGKPHVPLFSWEELGKMSPNVLRTLRHLEFSQYVPSADGAYYQKNRDAFEMELALPSLDADMPLEYMPPLDEQSLPEVVRISSDENEESSPLQEATFDSLEAISMTELMTLYGMDEETATRIKELVDSGTIESFEALKELDFIDAQLYKKWSKSFRAAAV